VITGHLALAYAAGGAWKEQRLLWLFGAALFPDAVDAVLALAKVCSPYGLYSHSLPSLALQAVLVAAACWGVTRNVRLAVVGAALIGLHLALDFVTGTKVWWPYATPVGLDLYKHPLVDFALETAMVVPAWRYARRVFSGDWYFVSKSLIVSMVALQCALNVAKLYQITSPLSSQSDSCKASYQVRKR
jgi:hypothetical protein